MDFWQVSQPFSKKLSSINNLLAHFLICLTEFGKFFKMSQLPKKVLKLLTISLLDFSNFCSFFCCFETFNFFSNFFEQFSLWFWQSLFLPDLCDFQIRHNIFNGFPLMKNHDFSSAASLSLGRTSNFWWGRAPKKWASFFSLPL